MKEELYIIKDKERCKLDLNSPSGITLSFVSNLFNDLSKISCSYSYTFNIPMTKNNREVLNCVEDIRCRNSISRSIWKGEFFQNGVMLFKNANLYIDEFSKGYKVVMTWDVLDGFKNLKDNDCQLNELTNNETMALFGKYDDKTTDFDNTKDVLYPVYSAGAPIQYGSFFYRYPMPVVPVRNIIKRINEYFNVSFKLGNDCDWNRASNSDLELIDKGVLPLVDLQLTENQQNKGIVELSGCNKVMSLFGCKNGLVFSNITIEENELFNAGEALTDGSYVYPKDYNSNRITVGVANKLHNIGVEFDGFIKTDFEYIKPNEWPELIICQAYYTREGIKTRELARKKGARISENRKTYYIFNFREEEGYERLRCEALQTGDDYSLKSYPSPIFFYFSYDVVNVHNLAVTCYPLVDSKCSDKHSIDIIKNLPKIGCLNFMKSIFYMIGAFPYVNKNNEIEPLFYRDIEKNLKNGDCLNWSNKVLGHITDLTNSIVFKVSGFAQRNYYLSKNDDLDKTVEEKEEEKDIYDVGIGCIEVPNTLLDATKTVIQVPFYSQYIKNNNNKREETGNTIKCWEKESSNSSRYKFCNPKPAYGIIEEGDNNELTMSVWNGFKDISNNEFYKYFSKILKEPYIIKENLILDEFDLRDIDYTKPIYIEKYNSYFVVIKITRGRSNICNCEFIKLPN